MLGSPHGSSPASPFNPRPGLTSYSPGQSGRGLGGHGARQPGMGGRVPIGAAAYDRTNNSSSSNHLQSPPDNGHLGGPHSYSQPEIHDMAKAHGGDGQDGDSGRDTREAYGNEGLGQQGVDPTANGMGKPVLQRAWSDGAEQVGINRRVEDPRDRLQGFKEEDERYGAQDADSRGRRVESDRGDVRGHANNQAEDLERPFAMASPAFLRIAYWPRSCAHTPETIFDAPLVCGSISGLCDRGHRPISGWQDYDHPQGLPILGSRRACYPPRRGSTKQGAALYRQRRDWSTSSYASRTDIRGRPEARAGGVTRGPRRTQAQVARRYPSCRWRDDLL
jgi:hypothetical protein